tara:strand:- start:31 stop:483 length:453 start_codon:yes stop_codon:yes gene_type:complete
MINLKNSEQMSSLYALLAAALFAFLSFYGTDADTYLFPRIIAIVLTLLALVLFIGNSAKGGDNRDSGIHFKAIWPGLVIGLIFALVMEDLGFYASSFLAFLAILMFYGKRSPWNASALVKKTLVSLAFMVILYLLFWIGLNVRTPTGLLF